MGAIDFQQLDVDDDFRTRLVDGGDDAARRGHPLGCVLDGDGVGGCHRRQTPRVDDDPEDVDGLFQIGIAQVERANDFFFVLSPLGLRVRNDGDRLWRRHLPETACRAGHRGQRLTEWGVPEIDGDDLIAKRGIEGDADVRELADGGEDVAGAGFAKHQGLWKADAFGQVGARQGSHHAPVDDRLEPRLAVFPNGDLGPQLTTDHAQFGLDLGAGRRELRGNLVLDQRLLEFPGGCQTSATREVVLRGAKLGSVEAEPGVLVVRVLAKDPGVLRDGAVVVLPGLGIAGGGQRTRGRARRQRERKGHDDGQLERAAAIVDGCHC